MSGDKVIILDARIGASNLRLISLLTSPNNAGSSLSKVLSIKIDRLD